MSNRYRLENTHNRWQGDYKRVLCVCSAGLLRSPTAAFVLSKPPFNYNTRAAGFNKEYCLIPVDEYLLEWCQEVVCMNKDLKMQLELEIENHYKDYDDEWKEKYLPRVINLNISDSYAYRDPNLIKRIKKNYKKALEELRGTSVRYE